MKNTIQRMVLALVAAAITATGMVAPANAQQQQGRNRNKDAQPEVVRPAKNPSKTARQAKQPRDITQTPKRVETVQQDQRVNPNGQMRRATRVQQQDAPAVEKPTVEQQQQIDRQKRQADRRNRQVQQQQPNRQVQPNRPNREVQPDPQTIERPTPNRNNPDRTNADRPNRVVVRPAPVGNTIEQRPLPARVDRGRLPEQKQRQLITQQQQRVIVYDRNLRDRERIAEQRARILQQQRRIAQYQYQLAYAERLRQQQLWLAQQQSYNYYNDPYFYTAPSYRYQRAGSWYSVNQYGANLLQQAVNYGYQQGFEAGRADREDNWRFGFQDSYAYQDANWGYTGFYVDQSQYNYYFRQGFERGYQDGYYGRYQYGSYSNGTVAILGAVLNTILAFQSF